MSDKDWYLDEDGARYAIFLQVPDDPNDQYGVDLVRHAQDENGLLREQRLTLAQYNSYGEAEEHFYEAEQQIQDSSLEDFGVDALATMPYSDAPTILTAHFPPDAEGDERATTNILVIAEDGIQATRLAEGDIETQQELVAQLDLAQIEGGDDRLLDEATELAEVQGQHAPATPLFAQQDVETPADLLPFAIGENMQPFDADGKAILHLADGGGTVHWFGVVERDDNDEMSHELRYFRSHEGQDDEVLHDSYPVMPLPNGERETAWVLPDLERHLQAGNIYTAQQLAYNVAEVYEQEFPDPLDLSALNPEPEFYFGYGIGPSDSPSLEAVKTWMDGSERRFDTLTVGEYGMFEEAAVDEAELEELVETEGLQAAMNLAETMAVAGGYLDPEREDPRIFFEDDAPADPFTTNRGRELAQPRYSIGAISANGVSFLDVYKEWGVEDVERLVVPQRTWGLARDNAVMANNLLDEDRLQDAMQLVEQEAVDELMLEPDRHDPRLFTQGPLDPFQTMREEEIDDELAKYGVTWRETHQWETESTNSRESEVNVINHPYWRLDSLLVNNPEGKSLGHALHMVIYPDIPAGQNLEITEDTPFQMMEMAHFETKQQMENFREEFHSFLKPDVLEGPELAQEVARLEGLSAEYTTLEGQELHDYRNAELTLMRTPEHWHPHNPNAEREVRIKAEGLYNDSIYDPIYDSSSNDDIDF